MAHQTVRIRWTSEPVPTTGAPSPVTGLPGRGRPRGDRGTMDDPAEPHQVMALLTELAACCLRSATRSSAIAQRTGLRRPCERTINNGFPLRTEYRITDRGRELRPADRAVPHRPVSSPTPEQTADANAAFDRNQPWRSAAPKARRLKYCASSPISRSLGSHDCQYWRPHLNDQRSGATAHSAVRGNVARTVRPWESPVHDQVAVRASTVSRPRPPSARSVMSRRRGWHCPP